MASFDLVELDHVQLAMPPGEENTARRFYSDLLGIPELKKPDSLKAGGGAWFEHGKVKVHLGVEENFRPAKKAHPAFVVSGLSNLKQVLISAGCKVVEAPVLNGRARFHAFDPFGNRLEFMDADH